MGRRIAMHFGDVEVLGVLNGTETAQAFAAQLPMAVRMGASTVGCCGRAPVELPFDAGLVHRGWRNGDINYNPGGGWLAVFFDDEENSRRYGDQLTLGRIDGDLAPLRSLAGAYDVFIEPVRE